MSLTYDHGWSGRKENAWEQDIERLLRDSAVPMDFDWTPHYMGDGEIRYGRDSLKPRGISFFGHGYYHINADALSEDSARANFLLCKTSMLAHGIKAVSYAYAGGYGFDAKTRRACKDAGFLSARLFSMTQSPLIIPDSETAPRDWFSLPTVPMFSAEYHTGNVLLRGTDYRSAVHSTQELVPYLDETVRRGAWLILTYHAINNTPDGTYRFRDFQTDVSAIKARHIWCTGMNTVILYLKERIATRLQTTLQRANNGAVEEIRIHADDGLPNDFYNVPLTVQVLMPHSWQEKNIIALQNGVECAVQRIDKQKLLVFLRPTEQECVLHTE